MVSHNKPEPYPPEDWQAEPVLILTPTGRDASVVAGCLHEAGMQTRVCHDITDFCAWLDAAAAGLIAEEALLAPALDLLIAALKRQPAWSDVPLMVLTTPATTPEAMRQFVQELGAVGNVTLLERPLYQFRLLSTVRVALRARRRQHEVRQLHNERERRLAEQMAVLEKLHKSEKSLRHLNETLEQRVTNRTAELEQQAQRLQHEMRERQRMQEALFQQEKLAALGTLLANVAHELNNPLAVAALQLDNLQEEGSSGVRGEDLGTLRQAVERCQSVVQSFLALARQQAPERHAVGLNAVIGDVLVLLRRALEVDGITIESHLEDDLPPLWADANQLHHVVRQSHHQCAPCPAGDRCAPAPAAGHGDHGGPKAGDPGGGRQRAGHPTGRAAPHLRPLLYHQTSGRGQRFRVAAVPQHCGGTWGLDPSGECAWTWHDGFRRPAGCCF